MSCSQIDDFQPRTLFVLLIVEYSNEKWRKVINEGRLARLLNMGCNGKDLGSQRKHQRRAVMVKLLNEKEKNLRFYRIAF